MAINRVATAIEKLNSRTFYVIFQDCFSLFLQDLQFDFQYHSFMYLFFVLIIKENSFTVLSR